MKQKTAYAEKKDVQLKHTKAKLKELKDVKMTPKKKNLVKKLKNLIKWNSRKDHAIKRDKIHEKPLTGEQE